MDHTAVINANACKEAALARDIPEMKSEESGHLLRRHYLRATDPSLRELTNRLKAAYLCRDQKQQILLKEYHKLQDKAAEERAQFTADQAVYNARELIEREQKENMQRKLAYQKEVRQQCLDNQLSRQRQHEDRVRGERKMMEDDMKAVIDSDATDMKQKRERWMRFRRERAETEQAQDARRKGAEADALREAQRVREQTEAVAARELALLAEKRTRDQQRDERNQTVAARLNAIKVEQQRREELIKQLEHQEFLEMNKRDDTEEYESSERTKRRNREATLRHFMLRDAIREQQCAQEASCKEMLDVNFRAGQAEETERLVQMRAQKQQYGQELQQQMRENGLRRQREARSADVAGE